MRSEEEIIIPEICQTCEFYDEYGAVCNMYSTNKGSICCTDIKDCWVRRCQVIAKAYIAYLEYEKAKLHQDIRNVRLDELSINLQNQNLLKSLIQNVGDKE